MKAVIFPSPLTSIKSLVATGLAGIFLIFSGASAQDKPEEKKEAIITEEITVVGRAPQDASLASVSRLEAEDVALLKPRDLSQALALSPGVNLSVGQKNESTLFLRGMDARRIVLLLDGVPLYEPYFSTFDLKTVMASDVSSLQVTRGPASVLYGPNTLAGLVNVITGRPGNRPSLSVNGSFDQDTAYSLGLNGAFRWKRLAFSGSTLYQDSNGFHYPDAAGGRSLRALSDYRRLNLNAKLYYYPTESSELLVSGNLYRSAYGLPPALEVQRTRYWRFKQWDRASFSAGGFLGLGRGALLRFRAYSVQYDNVLEQFKDSQLEILQAQSTYDNSVLGFFGLADLSLIRGNTLKVSLHYQADRARIQDNAGLPWQEYHQSTLSGAVEDHFRLAESLMFVAGLSLDVLDKFTGPTAIRANPLAGLRLSPAAGLDLSLSLAKKSRFPSMRSLYSSGSGNPDLLSEDGVAYQLGGKVEGWATLETAVFLYNFRDMIDSVQQPDGTRRYINVGRAYIRGLEVGVWKELSGLSAAIHYTYLDHRNQTDGRPLDTIPRHTVQANVSWVPVQSLRLSVFGLAASASFWFNSSTQKLLEVPAYSSLDAVVSYGGTWGEVFLKASNIFDQAFYTDPGFPWPGRTLQAGFKLNVLKVPAGTE